MTGWEIDARRSSRVASNAGYGVNISPLIALVNKHADIFLQANGFFLLCGELLAGGAERSASRPLASVFNERVGVGLPLHVGRVVGAAGTQGDDVVGDVAGAGAVRLAGGRAGVQAFEGGDGGRVARRGGVRRGLAGGEREVERPQRGVRRYGFGVGSGNNLLVAIE